MRVSIAAVAVLMATAGCSEASGNALASLQERVAAIDVDAILDEARDCDRLSELFVGAVGAAADQIDDLAERTNGRIPQTQIHDLVDEVSVNRFYEVAERLGCAEIQLKVDMIDRLRGLVSRTPESSDFLDEVRHQVERD